MANLKRILSLVLALVMIAGMLPEFPHSAKAAETVGGAHGENITWEISTDGVLTLSGTGEVAMAEYDDALEASAYPWTYHKDQVTKIVIGEGITQLPNAAFADFVNVTEIVLPGTLTHTQSNTFCNTGITRVELPEGMEFLGSGCFAYCEKLEYVQLPSSMMFISDWTFDSCTNLKTVVMPQMPNLEYINEGAFYGCTALTDISWYSAEILYGDLFTECTGLVDIKIPEGVTEVWSRVFYNCSNLKRIEFPKSLTQLGSRIFECESGLTMDAVVFQGAAPSFESDAFGGLTATCYYPENDPTWTADVMQNYGGSITWVAAEMGEEDPSSSCGDNLTWELVDGTLTVSGEGAMYDYRENAPWQSSSDAITNVVIQEGVTSVGAYAFRGCFGLTEVSLPSTLTSIGECAFADCNGMTKLVIPYKVTEICDSAFGGCIGLQTITFRGDPPAIGTNAFQLVEAAAFYPYISDNWTDDLLQDYGGTLTWVGIDEPHDYEAVVTPPTCSDAGYTTYTCTICGHSFTSNYTNSVDHSYVDGACQWCGKSDSVGGTCGANMTWVLTSDGTLTISGDGYLDDFGAGGAPWYDIRFDIKKVVLPESLLYITRGAFADCINLEEVELPDTLYGIEGNAFRCCMSLKEITFPETLNYIAYQAFEDAALTDITITGSVIETLDSTAFNSVTATVHYPGNDTTWHEAHRLNYGGNLTWEPYEKPVTQLDAGTCGDNLTWTLTSDGILTISGTGPMTNYKKIQVSAYASTFDMPWLNYLGRIGKVVVEEGITSIGSYAFAIMSHLREVEIPDSVTAIGANAFWEDQELLHADLPDGVTEIGQEAFYNCCSLAETDLPETLRVIGYSAFHGCSSLTEMALPEKLEQLGSGAFRGCSGIQSIIIPKNIHQIGSDLFYGCSSLTSVEMHDAIDRINNHAFYGCSSLTEIQIPYGVCYIDQYAFSNSGLTEITFTGSMPSFGVDVFRYLHAVVRYPANRESWVAEQMQDYGGTITWESYELPLAEIDRGTCGENLTWVLTNDGKLTITGTGAMTDYEYRESPWDCYRSAVTDLIISEGITHIGNNAFVGLRVKELTLPNTVLSIGDHAFESWGYLAKLVLPDSVTTVGAYAFFDCRELYELVMSDSVTTIGNGAFAYCMRLTDIKWSENLTAIGDEAFCLCEMTQLVLPESLITIGNGAFQGCMSLTEVKLPNNLQIIGDRAFCETIELHSITIPAGVTRIGSDAFAYSYDFGKNITFLGAAPEFGEGAFRDSTINVYYPGDDASWTADVMQQYGGMVTWIRVGGEPVKPAAPTVKISNVASTGKIKLTWDAVEGAEQYEVYRSTDKETWSRLTTTAKTSMTNTSATAGKLYYYYVVAVDANGNKSDPGDVVSRRCDLPQPEITLSNIASSGKIKISWEAIEGAVKYEVYRSTDNETWSKLTTTTKTYVNNTSTTAGTLYYYKVKAIHENSAANSAYSAVKNRRCDLPQPEITLSNIASSGKIKISWEAIEGAVKYEVYRSTDNETWSKLTTTTKTYVNNTSTTAGTLYYYKVKAIHENSAANSAYSAVKNRRCDLPQPEITLSNIASSGKIKISWEAIEGAAKYEVYRSTDNETWSKLTTTTKTYVNNTSTTAGTLYYYKVKSIHENSAANSAYSAVKNRRCDLAQPEITLSNIASSGKIKISWEAIEDAVKYEVYRSTDNETWSKLTTTTKTYVNNTSTTAGTLYYYKVKAIHENSAASSAYSAVKNRRCDLARPTLSVTLNSKDKPYLSWTKVEGAVKYEVYRSTDNSTWTKLTTTANTYVTNTSAAAGTTYYYKVRAIASNSAANSAYSTAKSITAG